MSEVLREEFSDCDDVLFREPPTPLNLKTEPPVEKVNDVKEERGERWPGLALRWEIIRQCLAKD